VGLSCGNWKLAASITPSRMAPGGRGGSPFTYETRRKGKGDGSLLYVGRETNKGSPKCAFPTCEKEKEGIMAAMILLAASAGGRKGENLRV